MSSYYSKVGNIASVGWCSAGVGILGLIFMIAGAVITGIAYTEITPPNYDENYNRYIGASVPRLVGPFLLCFGAILLFGSCGFFGLAFYHANKENSTREFDSNGRPYRYNAASVTDDKTAA